LFQLLHTLLVLLQLVVLQVHLPHLLQLLSHLLEFQLALVPRVRGHLEKALSVWRKQGSKLIDSWSCQALWPILLLLRQGNGCHLSDDSGCGHRQFLSPLHPVPQPSLLQT
jgi:hypothetical protein